MKKEEVRELVFDHYGWQCACCGTTRNLSIDHVDGLGKEHREELGFHWGSERTYIWLVQQGFPDGFQAMCRPCNTSKGRGLVCRLHSAILVLPVQRTGAVGRESVSSEQTVLELHSDGVIRVRKTTPSQVIVSFSLSPGQSEVLREALLALRQGSMLLSWRRRLT